MGHTYLLLVRAQCDFQPFGIVSLHRIIVLLLGTDPLFVRISQWEGRKDRFELGNLGVRRISIPVVDVRGLAYGGRIVLDRFFC